MAPSVTAGPRSRSDDPLTFIDIFAGAGGLSLGLLQAGLRGLFAIEREPNAFETLYANLIAGTSCPQFEWPGWLAAEPRDIAGFLRLHHQRLVDLRGSVDLLAGGPPCQGFSPAGRREASDPRNHLFRLYLETARLLQPTFVVFENVPWIAIPFGQERRRLENPRGVGRPPITFAQRLVSGLTTLGFKVFVLNEIASDFGVPQARRRYLIFGVRDTQQTRLLDEATIDLLLAEGRHSLLTSLQLPTERAVTVTEAISDLETRGRKRVRCDDYDGFQQIAYTGPLTSYQRALRGDMSPRIPPNSMRLPQHRQQTIARFEQILATCRKGVAIRPAEREQLGIGKVAVTPLHPDRPSKTLTSLPDDFLHYSEPRILTVREYARLQSFPDWFEFKGKYTTGGLARKHTVPRYTQVANAVPPLLARVIGGVAIKLQDDIDTGRFSARRAS